MWKQRVTAVLGVMALLSGCISFGPQEEEISLARHYADAPANVMVYRRPAFFLDQKPIILTVDGEDVLRLDINQYFELGLSGGHHVLGVKCPEDNGSIIRSWRHQQIELSIMDSSTRHFIELGPCTFKERSQEETAAVIGTYKPADPDRDWTSDLTKWLPGFN